MIIALIVFLVISIALVAGICYFKRLERRQTMQIVQLLDEVERKQDNLIGFLQQGLTEKQQKDIFLKQYADEGRNKIDIAFGLYNDVYREYLRAQLDSIGREYLQNTDNK